MHPHLEGHTLKRFDGELGNLHMRVLEMGGLAGEQIRQALQALKEKDIILARRVISRDIEVDKLEVKADEEIANLLARRCPVARDLRAVLAFSKAISDLERIGDEAIKIADMAVQIYDNDSADPSTALLRDAHTIGRQSLIMLHEALDAFDNLDVARATKVAAGHSELELEFQCSIRRLATFIIEDPRNLGHTIKAVLIIKALERIGDHAKNIAEYIIYMVSGEDVRHHYNNGESPYKNQESLHTWDNPSTPDATE
jgi:phosphate transport system protein